MTVEQVLPSRWRLTCDWPPHCMSVSAGGWTVDEAKEEAHECGWTVSDHFDYCGKHRHVFGVQEVRNRDLLG